MEGQRDLPMHISTEQPTHQFTRSPCLSVPGRSRTFEMPSHERLERASLKPIECRMCQKKPSCTATARMERMQVAASRGLFFHLRPRESRGERAGCEEVVKGMGGEREGKGTGRFCCHVRG